MQTEILLRHIGFDVATSAVECCGMAGSFGYKKDLYELSMAVGEDLFEQVRRSEEGASRGPLWPAAPPAQNSCMPG